MITPIIKLKSVNPLMMNDGANHTTQVNLSMIVSGVDSHCSVAIMTNQNQPMMMMPYYLNKE